MRTKKKKTLTLAQAAAEARAKGLLENFFSMSDDGHHELLQLLRRTRWRQASSSKALGHGELRAFQYALQRQAKREGFGPHGRGHGRSSEGRGATNAYGLTLSQWLRAAAVSATAKHRAAWRAGEDPSDYRADADARRAKRKANPFARAKRPSGRFPRYHSKSRTFGADGNRGVASDYLSLAKFEVKQARALDKAIADRKRERGRNKAGSDLLRHWRQQARTHRARAKRFLEMARRRRGVYSRSSE